MIRSHLLLIALLPFAVLTAHAQNEITSQGQETVVAQKAPRYGRRATSEQNREGKTVTVAAQLTGGKSWAGNGMGVHAGFFVNPDTLIQLEVSKNDGGFWWDDMKTTSFAVYGKNFLSNSFYLMGGIDHTLIKADHQYIYSSSGNTDAYGFEGSVTSVAFALGNQWQWQNFTLGCDWFGLTVPVAHNVSSEYADSSYDSSSNDHQKRLLEESSVQYLRFYVGYTF